MRTHEVLIVVHRQAEFLVVLRAPERGGFWHLPSGGVEPAFVPAVPPEPR